MLMKPYLYCGPEPQAIPSLEPLVCLGKKSCHSQLTRPIGEHCGESELKNTACILSHGDRFSLTIFGEEEQTYTAKL